MKVGKIEHGIPIPPKCSSSGDIPFRDLSVNDSVMITMKQSKREQNKLTGYASAYGYRLNMKFTVRKIKGGYRIWRIG